MDLNEHPKLRDYMSTHPSVRPPVTRPLSADHPSRPTAVRVDVAQRAESVTTAIQPRRLADVLADVRSAVWGLSGHPRFSELADRLAELTNEAYELGLDDGFTSGRYGL